MLVRRCVAHDLRAVLGEHRFDARPVAHGADQRDEIKLRAGVVQLLLDVVGVVFVNIKDDEPFRRKARDLAAQLAADAAAAARDEHGLAAEVPPDLGEIGLHLVAAEQVLDLHVADLFGADLAACQLVKARQDLELAARALADLNDLARIAA